MFFFVLTKKASKIYAPRATTPGSIPHLYSSLAKKDLPPLSAGGWKRKEEEVKLDALFSGGGNVLCARRRRRGSKWVVVKGSGGREGKCIWLLPSPQESLAGRGTIERKSPHPPPSPGKEKK